MPRTPSRGRDGLISAVSYSEPSPNPTRASPLIVNRALVLKLIVPFDEEHAVMAASFRAATRGLDVSFADRAYLGAAALARLPVLTADRKWEKIKCAVESSLFGRAEAWWSRPGGAADVASGRVSQGEVRVEQVATSAAKKSALIPRRSLAPRV